MDFKEQLSIIMHNAKLSQAECENLENLLSVTVIERQGSSVLKEVPSVIFNKLSMANQLELLSSLLNDKVNSLNTDPEIEDEIMIG